MALMVRLATTLLLLLLFQPRNTEAQNAALCAEHMIHALSDCVDTANAICQAAVDCTLPGLDELACASDITNGIEKLADLSMFISYMTLSCGHLGNTCVGELFGGFMEVAKLSEHLIAAADDCAKEPLLCILDITSAINNLNGFIFRVIGMVSTCNRQHIESTQLGHEQDFFGAHAPEHPEPVWNILQTRWQYSYRRLSESPASVVVEIGAKTADAANRTL